MLPGKAARNSTSSVKEMLPWFFDYDHTNYARYLVTIVSLKDTQPEAHQLLADGNFGVQKSTSHGFSQLPVDEIFRQTMNRSTKKKGGTVAFQSWMLTAHSRAALADKCRVMVSMDRDQDKVHRETGYTRMQRGEADVRKVMEVVRNWCDPFAPEREPEV